MPELPAQSAPVKQEKKRYPHGIAHRLAVELMEELAPFCERIIIAGSLRRNRPDVGDIELLYIPSFEDRQADMFTTEPADVAGEKIDAMLAAGTFSKRPKIDGTFTWGKKNRLAIHRDGIPVDLFATTQENWWVSLVIRTGGKETNLRLTNGALAKGMHLNAYGSGFTLQNKRVVTAHSERDVFELAGVRYAAPEDRP